MIANSRNKTVEFPSAAAAGGTSFGVCGIANAAGEYTYYATLQAAIDAASSGDTIEIFADITETNSTTASIIGKNLNINFHGHTYTLNNANQIHAISITNASNVNLTNGTIKRLGNPGIAVHLMGYALYVNSDEMVDLTGMKFTGVSGIRSNSEHRGGTVHDVTVSSCYAGNSTIYDLTVEKASGIGINSPGGYLYNCQAHSLDDIGILVAGGATNCTGISQGGAGIKVVNATCKIVNCYGWSSTTYGIWMTTGRIINCSGYSNGASGIYATSGTCITGSYGESTVSYGIQVVSGTFIIEKCSAYSILAPALYISGGAYEITVINCNAFCTWNNAGGHGIEVVHVLSKVVGCYSKVTHADAYNLYCATSKTIHYSNNKFRGATTPVHSNITQLQTLSADDFGNISIE